MANTSVVAAVHLVAASKEARDELYSQLVKIIEYTKANEPETLRYALCVPDKDEPDADADTTLYIFEEYASKDVWEKHMTSTPVVDFLKFLQSDPAPVRPETSVKHLSWIPEALLEQPARLPSGSSNDSQGRVEHPFVLWATITDPQTADISSLAPYGAAIVKYAEKNEPDTIFYGDARIQDLTPSDKSDDVKGGFIAALEVYTNRDAWLAHLKDDTVKALSEQAHRLDSTFGLVQLNMVEGWLTRD